jgi:hypothetical protein
MFYNILIEITSSVLTQSGLVGSQLIISTKPYGSSHCSQQPTLDSISCHMNPGHTSVSYLLTAFNIIFLFITGAPKYID